MLTYGTAADIMLASYCNNRIRAIIFTVVVDCDCELYWFRQPRYVTKRQPFCNNESFEEALGGTLGFVFLQMSQRGDSENDIWDYKSLGKRKKQPPPPAAEPKRRYTSRKSTKKVTSFPTKSAEIGDGRTGLDTPVDRHNSPDAHNLPSESSTGASQSDGEGSSGDFCPMCQMPFSILVVLTQRWHVAECLDTPRDKCKGEASMFISAPQVIHIQASICICLLLCSFIV